jgi:hypothetical protein
MGEPRITYVDFEEPFPTGGSWTVLVELSDGSRQRLFAFYKYQLSFTAVELLGLTVTQGRLLKKKRDAEYQESGAYNPVGN